MGNFAMSYSKKCDRCGNLIFLEFINGKWASYDDQFTSILHRCINSSKSDALQDKVQSLEKIVRRLYDTVQIQSEKLRELENRIKTKRCEA